MPIAVIARAVLALVVFPLLLYFYTEKGKRPGGSAFERWFLKNQYFWLLLVIISVALIIEVKTYQPTEHRSPIVRDLQFFRGNVYKGELDKYTPPSTMPNWENEKKQLMRQFEYAQYAWDAKDYQRSIDALMALETGKDKVGEFYKVPSFVVSNNLGCVFFKQQRNKGFIAFVYFQAARGLADSAEHRTAIEDNLKSLDEMVNLLD